MITPAINSSNEIVTERDFIQEQHNLDLKQGVISEFDYIFKQWELAEHLIRDTINKINFITNCLDDYSVQVETLQKQAKQLSILFDKIEKVITNEPTFCFIKQSKIVSLKASWAGIGSGSAGIGLVLYNYITNQAPTIAPILLAVGGVVVSGFQAHIGNKLKKQQKERTKLSLLRGRSSVITEAFEMAKLLKQLTRSKKKKEKFEYNNLLAALKGRQECLKRESRLSIIDLKKNKSVYTTQGLIECSRIQPIYFSITKSNSLEASYPVRPLEERIEVKDEVNSEVSERKARSISDTVIEIPIAFIGIPKDEELDKSEVEIFGDN